MTCRDAARVSDLEQPLLDNGSKSDRVPGSAAQNGHARSEASEAAGSELEAAAPARAVPSVWRDPVLPATVAAVLCLWVLKLVQQGYVDGVLPSLPPRHSQTPDSCLRLLASSVFLAWMPYSLESDQACSCL